MAKFELVQRLADAHKGPVNFLGDPYSLGASRQLRNSGAFIDLDYMGSSEYDDPRILIRSANKLAAVSSQLKIVTGKVALSSFNEDVVFLCTDEQTELLQDWETWSRDPWTKEPTGYFDREGFEHIVGWWALNEDLIWTRETSVADNIRNAFADVYRQAELRRQQ